MLTSSDPQLIERFRQGDSYAFDALVGRHKERIFNLAYRMTGDADWAEDITVEVLLEVYASLPQFKNRAKFSTWLHRLAVNVCLEHLRARRSYPQPGGEPLEKYEAPASADPAEIAMNRDLAQHIAHAMQALPEAQRLAVIMYYLEERSCAEIAEILQIPLGTVQSRLARGRRLLRDELVADERVPTPLRGGEKP